MFSVTLSTVDTGHQHYSIMKEGVIQGSGYTYSAGNYAGCSATVTISCKRGEDVWVANTVGSSKTVDANEYKGSHSHFTGFRLY